MDEKDFKTERMPSNKALKTALTWEQEVLHLCGPFVESLKRGKTLEAMKKFHDKYQKDPMVREFHHRYLEVLKMLQPLWDSKIEDSIEKLNFVLRYFQEDPSRIKVISDFVSSTESTKRKYKIFDIKSERMRRNNLTPSESAELDRNLSPVFQWLPKVELHLQSKKLEYAQQANASTDIARRFQYEMQVNDLEDLFKEQGPNPFKSIFSTRRQQGFARVQTCRPEHIAEFLIRHKDDHPEYVDTIFRKPKKGDRDFLKEFDVEHDHASLKKLYSVGMKYADKINKAYRYRLDVRMSLEECKEKFLDKAIPKELQIALVAKMEKNHKDGFNMPTTKELSDFVNDLKAALNSPKGLKHADYLKLLNTTPPRSALFGLESHIFENSKVFKARPDRPAPVAPPRVSIAKPVSQVKPQRY